ncbi:MAG: glutathione S-transferase family protein [Gammaproteobacteria bacterium]|nr:glutathione S-transferase family protein [Gammaproteobacteria bacterium]MBI5616063.1 glutathione S-transferase family protein [Gammaproteobacteria bacterium]
MIKLYGFPISNYYNMVKLAMLEKGLAFEEENQMPSQEAAFKSMSPMGKVPCIETPEGFLSETSAILEYLDELKSTPALLPAHDFARAKVREIVRVIELYVELPARRHYPHLFFGAPRNEAAVEEAKPVLERGIAALKQLCHFRPFVGGEAFGMADIYAYYTFGLANAATKGIYNWDIIQAIPGLGATMAVIGSRASTKKCDAAREAAMAAFVASKK